MAELVPIPMSPDVADHPAQAVRSHLRSRMKRLLSMLSSVPESAEEGAAFFQRRLRSFVIVQLALWTIMLLANWTVNYVLFPIPEAGTALGSRTQAHLAAIVLLAAMATALRRPLSLEALAVGDVAATLVPAAALAAMTVLGTAAYRSDLPIVIGLTHILTLRAALVPSPPLRTLHVGMASQAMLVAAAGVLFASEQAPVALRGPKAAIQDGVWGLIAIITTVSISHVIYRLRARVSAAESFGQYAVTKKLGEGASGIVYLAEHNLLRRPTALKLLKRRELGVQAASRFEREAQQLSRMSHPNIVALYDYGHTPEGQLYYAMEYIQGVDLETLVERVGPLSAVRVVDLLRQAAEALAEAHEAGLVHRDVKPGNLVLCKRTRSGELLKLVDFGLAKDLGFAGQKPGLTDAHAVVGTPFYMPPEAVTNPETVGPASDVYSLGAVGYFLLTGKPVFDAKTAVEVLYQHLYSKVPSLNGDGEPPIASALLESLITRCLAKDPPARPTAHELGELLVQCEHGWPIAECRAWWTTHESALARPMPEPLSLKFRMSLERRITAAG